ncbi:hypothetical protein ACWGJ6_23525 [Streptomyces canus]
MAIEQQVFFIAKCDICGAYCDEAGDVWLWDITRQLAAEQAADTPGWTEVKGGIVCPISDRKHDEARGAESPLLAAESKDAVRVSFEEAS